jgi:A/G-specific adenine glycosylase
MRNPTKKSAQTRSFAIRKSSIIKRIFRWYSRTARELPWRGERNHYRILISEVMLQQTQVSRVLLKYPQFLKRFPEFGSLARANTSSVIREWKGMGYNNRAVRLQKLARIVIADFGGNLPTSVDELQSLPGIGKYTANALACLAFDQHVPVVDTNIIRVLGRIFPKESTRMDIWKLAELVLPKRKAHVWNQALMDLGATICTSRSPRCDVCPVTILCPSAFRMQKKPLMSAKKEPSRDGLPNRIYRGRIVDALRLAQRNRFVLAARLGKLIKHSFSRSDKKWLDHLMEGLEKDGLIILKHTRTGLAASLPQ